VTPTLSETVPKITFTRQDGEHSTRVELWADGKAVSRLWVIPFTLRVGRATVRMDGIGGVGTPEECRNQGYARRMLEGTVEWMAGRDAALTMLYGIPNFYPKFGYATAGPDHLLQLPLTSEAASLPEGWRVRGFRPEDLPAVQRLYDLNTAAAVGAAVRTEEKGPWYRILKTPDTEFGDEACVVLNPAGDVAAYAWKGSCFWYIRDKLAGEHPDALVLGEVMAESPRAADAVLAACRIWAGEEARKREAVVKRVLLSLPPEGYVADAARHHRATFQQNYSATGESMARVLNVERLLQSLAPELEARLSAAHSRFTGGVRIDTEIGGATLQITPGCVRVDDSPAPPDGADAVSVDLPQPTLARLALGAVPPADLLDRLERPVSGPARELLEILFPYRHPHMYIPDRY
jgi:hypothetical protein